MPNIKAEIHKHNKNTLEKAQQKYPDTQLCNFTNKTQCPLNRQCLTESIVYFGVSKTRFKVPYGNHKKSFTKRHKNNTELSKEY